MDGLSALSVASNAVQIVDFGVRFLSQIMELRKSQDGQIEEFQNLHRGAQRLCSLNDVLIKDIKTRQANQRLTELEQNILSLCIESDSVTTDLLEQLKGVSLDQQDSGIVAALQVAIKVIWKRKNIKSLQQRLSGLRDTLTDTILVNMQ